MTLELLHGICIESGLSIEQADAVMAHIDDKDVRCLLHTCTVGHDSLLSYSAEC